MSRDDARSSALRRHPSRTIPAVIVAVLLTAAGVALVWASVVRLSSDRWPSWVGATHAWVAGQTWGSVTVLAISILVALVGVVLLVAALSPGQPNAYSIDPPEPDQARTQSREFVMTRRSVAKLATAQAHLVDGVDSVSATVSGRAVNLHVKTPSAHRNTIEQAVTAAVTQAITAAGLTPMPKISTTARTTQS